LLHLVGILSSRFTHDARSQEHKSSEMLCLVFGRVLPYAFKDCSFFTFNLPRTEDGGNTVLRNVLNTRPKAHRRMSENLNILPEVSLRLKDAA